MTVVLPTLTLIMETKVKVTETTQHHWTDRKSWEWAHGERQRPSARLWGAGEPASGPLPRGFWPFVLCPANNSRPHSSRRFGETRNHCAACDNQTRVLCALLKRAVSPTRRRCRKKENRQTANTSKLPEPTGPRTISKRMFQENLMSICLLLFLSGNS